MSDGGKVRSRRSPSGGRRSSRWACPTRPARGREESCVSLSLKKNLKDSEAVPANSRRGRIKQMQDQLDRSRRESA